jgi:hypothetical protein
MLDWIIKEAQWKAGVFQDSKHVVAFDVGVVKSDVAVSEELRQALIEAVRPLEEVPEEQKDYHPGTDGKVVDLVHPSLFPVIYGQTRILPDQLISLEAFASHIGEGEVLAVRPKQECVTKQSDYDYWYQRRPHRPYSLKFQWLPCDVHFGPDDECRIASYINNLHPQRHRGLYQVIERILAKTIPMWNTTLSLLENDYKRIEYYEVEYEDHPEPEPEAADEDEEDDDEFCEKHWEWQRSQPVKRPEPGKFVPHPFYNQISLRKEYAERGLQVIVKLANIELTPEKPEYEGGSWHIEGQLVSLSLLFIYKPHPNDNRTNISALQPSTTMIARISQRAHSRSVNGPARARLRTLTMNNPGMSFCNRSLALGLTWMVPMSATSLSC